MNELLADFSRRTPKRPLDAFGSPEQVDHERESSTFGTFEKKRWAVLADDPLHNLGHLQHRVHFSTNANKLSAPLEEGEKCRQILESASPSMLLISREHRLPEECTGAVASVQKARAVRLAGRSVGFDEVSLRRATFGLD
jgi:hypothetical protein